ncbi:conserved exported hypothetical protein [Cupriavidus taiwanensis]|uniref:hypothetical protein n=1 Tax=Cupriavidus taiwanensis TaxID=164546 RepID=UPI000E126FAA|nr:hypothetical protein [Cupriavidus taiwanensis]SOZ19756.1 conserved exported hypothetical protein [Cupriavidus taiwanensis]SOZ32944.1 conserved exported hypothetical protein [Cupriavidus taiwanensis]SOZ48365.1 conserved exported hypothetical protein [Cupriavidus taiwanensis]
MPANPARFAYAARTGARRLARAAVLCAATLGATLAAACAGIGTGAMQDVIDSWKNISVEEAKRQWGPPEAVQALPAGTAYVWTDSVPAARPPGSGPRDAGMERTPVPGQCQRKLVANPNGIVTGGEWRGDACCITALAGRCAALKYRARG